MATYDDETIIVKDKIYIPTNTLDVKQVEDRYSHYLYRDAACRRCPNFPNRHNFECDQCPAFHGVVSTSNIVYKNGIEYAGIPLGDRLKVEKTLGISFDEYNILDKRIRRRFDYPVRMRKDFKLRDYQEKAENDWWKYKHGLIVAPPRSGKTPSMLHLIIRLGFRAILLANQHDFLQQFWNTLKQ